MKPRVHPVLRIFQNAPMMMTDNEDVDLGLANGTRTTVESVTLKSSATPVYTTLQNGVRVKVVCASEVQKITMRHMKKGIEPEVFSIEPTEHFVEAVWPLPEEFSTSARMVERFPMKFVQFPIVRNSCTTGHKLQGTTVFAIYIFDWNYATNWPYIVLSRVTEMKGVFIRKPLSTDLSKYAVPQKLTDLINRLKTNEPAYLDELAYYEILEN